ncbi:7-cyano-7-deazaguanine synthase [Robertmurraya siralis]|uniref:7-cyano-7-deazaguanine synthase n=2 Tax=Robertmurraya siralis TaxID=77777 RepID=A0A919WJA0_9BACI|nr:7-cyano-7-deazaguanine synthase [Robertmurraya siralis]
MDSTVLAYWLKNQNKKVLPIFLDYGQHFKDTELNSLKQLLPEEFKKDIRVIDISDIYKLSNSRMIKEPDLWKDDVSADDLYLPYRNLLFLSIAASLAQTEKISEIYSAFINSNHAKEIDCSKEFFDNLGGLLENYGTVSIKMPFRYFSKKEVADLGITLGVPISETFSCQASSTVHCGACPNCIDRLTALNSYSIS